MIGDWMGSLYDVGGRRWDIHLFLDHDHRFERTEHREPDINRRVAGRWSYDEAERVIRLDWDMPDDFGQTTSRWRVLSVTTCESSNILLVPRELVLGSRILPIIFYRVHCNGRAYGTGWQDLLPQLPTEEPSNG